MQAFEEWLENDARKVLPITAEDYHLITIEDAAEKAWRASLEWTLNRINYHYDDEFENSDIVKDIKKELKDES